MDFPIITLAADFVPTAFGPIDIRLHEFTGTGTRVVKLACANQTTTLRLPADKLRELGEVCIRLAEYHEICNE